MNDVVRRETIKSTVKRCLRCHGTGDREVLNDDGTSDFTECGHCICGYVCDVHDATYKEMRDAKYERDQEHLLTQVRRCPDCSGPGCAFCGGRGWNAVPSCCSKWDPLGCPFHYGTLEESTFWTRVADIVASEQEVLRARWKRKRKWVNAMTTAYYATDDDGERARLVDELEYVDSEEFQELMCVDLQRTEV